MPPKEPDSSPRDVVLVGPEVEQGSKRHQVLRVRKGDESEATVEVGELREAEEGKPILGELVSLRRREEHERLFDVEVLAKGPAAEARGRSGPPIVSSAAFRDGWERTFKKLN